MRHGATKRDDAARKRRAKAGLPLSRLVDFDTAALMLKCTVQHVRYLVRTGRLPTLLVGRRYRNGKPVQGIPLAALRERLPAAVNTGVAAQERLVRAALKRVGQAAAELSEAVQTLVGLAGEGWG